MNASEKMNTLKADVQPLLMEWLGNQSGATAFALAVLTPLVEAYVDSQLARRADDLDAELERAIDFLSRLRSDDASELLVGSAGAHYLERTETFTGSDDLGPWHRAEFFVGDPVQRPHPGDGEERVGEVHPGPGTVPVNSGTKAGDRPGR